MNRLEALLKGFIVRRGNTILDIRTNLMWQRKGPPRKYTLQQAIDYCRGLTLGDFTDWRLPTIDELKTLINVTREPTISQVFQCQRNWYLSSTATSIGNLHQQWMIDFLDGFIYNGIVEFHRPSGAYIRAVRNNLSDSN
jgi:hypothetical protein